MGCVVDIARGCSRFHAPTHKNWRSVHLETRPQLENPSAKPGCELSSSFSLQSLVRSKPCHRSSGQHAARTARPALSTSPRCTGGLSSCLRDGRPRGWIATPGRHRVRGSGLALGLAMGEAVQQWRVELGTRMQLHDSYNHRSSLIVERPPQETADDGRGDRLTPPVGSRAMDALDWPQTKSRTR